MKIRSHNFESNIPIFFIGKYFNATYLNELSMQLFLKQKLAGSIGLHVCFTTAKNIPNPDQIQVNELLTLIRLSKYMLIDKEDLSNVVWKILDLDAENSILSIYFNKGQFLEQEKIASIINHLVDKKRSKKAEHAIPSLKILCSKLAVNQSGFYLSHVENTLTDLLSHICQSSKLMRQSINHVLEVLNFSEDPQSVLYILQKFLEINIKNLQNTASESKIHCRRIDVALYLIFELSDKDISEPLQPLFNQAFDEIFTRHMPIIMLCRGLRHSFLKAMRLVKHSHLLIRLVQLTDTDDSISFQIIYSILRNRDCSVKDYHQRLIDQLFQIPKSALIGVARDLRRIVPSNLLISESSSTEIIDRINTELSNLQYIPEQEVWMARCLVLFYANCFNKYFLKWISTNYIRIKLNVSQRDTLLALAGYDTPFIISINKGLYSEGFRYKIVSPSQCQNVTEYMRMNMNEWGRIYSLDHFNKRTSQDNSLTIPPLISVIITTFDPMLDLFKLSLESIIYQSYQNLEIIIIDDFTPKVKATSLKKIVQKLQKNSNRSIFYHRNKKNIGQYKSRNNAILQAKGEFIAIQDDDDISHPERLYHQVQPLLLDSEFMATHACHLRISENSRIMVDGDKVGQVVGDAPVSFVWKRQVFEEIGGFLPTRSRGDVEFRNRMRRYYSKNTIKTIHQPLVLMRGGLGTVSSEKEYFFNSAINALRYMMNHTPKTIKDTFDMQPWIPRNLK